MFTFPPQTAYGKSIPKSRIYTHAAPSRRVRELFVSQLSEIVWAHKLSPETLRLPARPGVPEIQIFDLTLKTADLDPEVLHAIDRAVPYPVIHRLHSETGVSCSAAFKRPSAADAGQWVIGPRFTTAFVRPGNELPPLPTVLDLGHLHAALFAQLLPLPVRSGEDLAAHIARCETFLRLRRNIDQLTAKVRSEKHFNRRVALNQQLKPLLAERAALEGEHTRPRVSFPAPSPETGPSDQTTADIAPVPRESAPGPRGRAPEHARARVLPDS